MFNDISHIVYNMTTTQIFLEAELVIGRQEVVSKSIKYSMLKQLRYHGTNRDPTKIIEGMTPFSGTCVKFLLVFH